MGDNEALDPEIADLLGIDEEEEEITVEAITESGKPIPKTEFKPIDLKEILDEGASYSKIIGEGGEYGQRLHDNIAKFSKAKDKDEKSMFREKITPAFWNMLLYLVENFFENLNSTKQSLFRYGLLNSNFIDDNQKQLLIKINKEKKSFDGIFYVDEWLYNVGNGVIKPSAVDETIKSKKRSPSAIKSKMERKSGAREAEISGLRQKIEQHLLIEKSLQSSVAIIVNHLKKDEFGGIIAPYTPDQKKALLQVQDLVKTLLKSDREMESSYRSLKSLDQEISSLIDKGGNMDVEVDTKTVRDEFSSIRQMNKMTVGRQGNHFPFLLKAYMSDIENDICTKERLDTILKQIESVDPNIFKRIYKGEEHRIVPHFIIVPSYGDYGICWEPFERSNKATSKGRIAMPMYPRELKTALLYALGDLRWQVAKEKALHYWMEEGLTGYYYEYAQKNKLKGDLKEYFIQDYILWIHFESQGMQKLGREVRTIFWRYIPFPQSIKDNLKNRGYYYAELYKKDQTRAMSRGY
jgi:hypothetical protein